MRHLLSTRDLSREEAIGLLDIAEDMADTQRREIKKLPTLRGKTIVNLFFEDSTRTRISFEAAAKRLSADVINFAAKGSSVSKGESLQDTAQTLQAMGADAVVIRHAASGALFAFDAADSLVQALAKLSAPKSLVSWFGKRAPLNLPDLEYRTFSTTTRANARIAQARMIDRRETYLRGAA